MISNEIRIPVKWGHIAIKTWGNPSNEPIIFLHGISTNANSFNKLISYLPENFYYICPDLPGHGFSSEFSNWHIVSYPDYNVFLLLLMEHFKKESYVLVGHSIGAVISTFFTQLYPKKVKKLFLVDHLYFRTAAPLKTLRTLRKHCLDCAYPKPKTSFSYQQAINCITRMDYGGKLNEDNAKELLERMLIKVGEDRYMLTNDNNLKYTMGFSAGDDFIVRMMKENPIQHECVFIIASDVVKTEPIEDILAILKHVKVIRVDGDHQVHMKKPEVISGYLKEFLLGIQNKL